jgi:hypothetical protein
MRDRRKGGLSATTRVKVFISEIFSIARRQGINRLEGRITTCVKGECVSGVPGLSLWQVIQLFTSELGRTISVPAEAPNKLKRQGSSMAIW